MTGPPEKVHAVLEQALTALPDHAVLHRRFAESLARRQESAAVVRHYRRAIKLQPGDASAHAGLGHLLVLTGDPAAAQAEWERAFQLAPDFPSLRQNLDRWRRR